MFFTCKPIWARFWFNWREPIALAIAAVVFTGVFCGLWFGFDALGAAIVFASLLSYLVKFRWLDKLVLRIECPNQRCGKFIEVDTPWLCGYKQNGIEHENVNTRQYPFVSECEDCHKRPKAYQCHHCNKLIYLSVDQDKLNFAKRLGDTESRIDPRAAEVAKQLEKIQDKTRQLEVAKLDRQIKLEKILPDKSGEPSEEEEIQQNKAVILKAASKRVIDEVSTEQLQAESAERYKGHPELQKRWALAIADAAKRHKLDKLMKGK